MNTITIQDLPVAAAAKAIIRHAPRARSRRFKSNRKDARSLHTDVEEHDGKVMVLVGDSLERAIKLALMTRKAAGRCLRLLRRN